MPWTYVLITAAFLAAGIVVSVAQAAPVRDGPVTAELITDTSIIAPGVPFKAGIRFTMDDEWHLYWKNPGDSGAAPIITWMLPDGFTAGELRWPVPARKTVKGLTNYIYENEVLIRTTITPPSNLSTGENITLKAELDWLVCRIKCIPGTADVAAGMTAGAEPVPSAHRALFGTGTIPEMASRWIAAGVWTDDHLDLELRQQSNNSGTSENPEMNRAGDPDRQRSRYDFFPLTRIIVKNGPIDQIEVKDDTVRFRMPLNPLRPEIPAVFEGILLDRGTGPAAAAARAYHVRAPLARGDTDTMAGVEPFAGMGAPIATGGPPGGFSGGFWMAILLAFAGGIVLNLMPCVLPVLSLKILGIVQHARDQRRQVVLQGIMFTLGILVTFWLLAGLLIVLKTAGHELGWGFQLQSPVFVGVISILLFLFSLSLFGLYEIGGALTAVGGDGGRRGKTAAFFSGVTATVVATPCTAPFMGTAMGYALFQPAWVNLTVFTVLGFGMAVPYLFVSLWPGLARRIPKPGPWMVHLKEFMGFLLLGTVVWLAWVLAQLAGTEGLLRLMGMMLLAGFGAWLYGRWTGPEQRRGIRWLGRLAAAAVLAVVFIGGAGGFTSLERAAEQSRSGSGIWESWSHDAVVQARQEGDPVLIDFTASWCLTCQVNKKVALRTESVETALSNAGIRTFLADWTSRDPAITRALAAYGRNSVPLYVLYYPGRSEPVILPEVLTPGIVREYLKPLNISMEVSRETG